MLSGRVLKVAPHLWGAARKSLRSHWGLENPAPKDQRRHRLEACATQFT